MPIRRRTNAASLIEGLVKRYDWRGIALVGVTDHHVLSRLLGTATRCRVTVVARDLPTAGLRDTGLWTRIKGLCRSYESRARLIEATPLLGLEQLADDEQFSAVFLAGCEAATLYDIGGAWLPRVKSGGMLIGDGHQDLAIRAVLKVVAPSREIRPDGMWLVKVTRAVENELHTADPQHDDAAHGESDAVPDVPTKVGSDEDGVVGHAVAPDSPIDTGSVEGNAAHVEAPVVAEAEGEAVVAKDVAPPQSRRRGRPPGSRTKKAAVA